MRLHHIPAWPERLIHKGGVVHDPSRSRIDFTTPFLLPSKVFKSNLFFLSFLSVLLISESLPGPCCHVLLDDNSIARTQGRVGNYNFCDLDCPPRAFLHTVAMSDITSTLQASPTTLLDFSAKITPPSSETPIIPWQPRLSTTFIAPHSCSDPLTMLQERSGYVACQTLQDNDCRSRLA